MTYELAIGDRTYSSWSLRGWLLFERFGLEVSTRLIRLYSDDFVAALSDFAPAQTVPAALIDGIPVWDTLAIAETLAERHPDAGLWPADPARRMLARAITAEMHSSFRALRGACPMNLRNTWAGFEPDADVQADLVRIEVLWARARKSGASGPWLFGDYCIADAFFAPVAARIVAYDLPVGAATRAYVTAHLADPAFRRWRAMGLAENFIQPSYAFDLPTGEWPGPVPVPATVVTGETPINAACPYSGKPVAADSTARIDGRIIGFCNPFCRDKSVADAAAWPKLQPLLR